MSNKILMKGNEALSEAAIIAGCRHYFGYPITPQNEIPQYMSRRLPEVGGVFLQSESELAAINMVYGASSAGARVMTSSSSPGISLKQEGLSYMAGAELPAVVVNMMRGGPGLGNIAGSQSDYFQATRGGGHGDYRQIVLAPASVQELADLTVLAFDLADKYRMVVMILGDGYLAQMSEPLVLPQPTGKRFDKPWALTGAKGRKPNIIRSLFLKPDGKLEEHNLALQRKYQEIEKKEGKWELYECGDADHLLVAFGTAARVCRTAVQSLRAEGKRVGLFRPITLWPFPSQELVQASDRVRRILVVEMNLGQMIEDVRLAVNGSVEVDFYGRTAGMIPDPEEIVKRVEKYGKDSD